MDVYPVTQPKTQTAFSKASLPEFSDRFLEARLKSETAQSHNFFCWQLFSFFVTMQTENIFQRKLALKKLHKVVVLNTCKKQKNH